MKAMFDQLLFIFFGKTEKYLIGKGGILKKRGEGKPADPDAKMLMNTVTVVDAPIDLIGACQDDIAPTDGIDVAFHTEGDITVEIDIDLIKIVDMVIIKIHVVDSRVFFAISNFYQNIFAEGRIGSKRGVYFMVAPVMKQKLCLLQ